MVRRMKKIDKHQRYTVYDNSTYIPVIVNKTASECAKVMGIEKHTFYSYLTPSGKARRSRWVVVKGGLDGEPCEPKTIGQFMRTCRLKKGMQITKLSEMTGISKGLINFYESDKTYAGLMNLISIADALDVSLDELIGRKRK